MECHICYASIAIAIEWSDQFASARRRFNDCSMAYGVRISKIEGSRLPLSATPRRCRVHSSPLPRASSNFRTKSCFSKHSGQEMPLSAMMVFSCGMRSVLKSATSSDLVVPLAEPLKRREQISEDFFFRRSQILGTGTPFLIGCEISRLMGSR